MFNPLKWLSDFFRGSSTPVAPANNPSQAVFGIALLQRPDFNRTAPGAVATWLKEEIAWLKQEIEIKKQTHLRSTPGVLEWVFWVSTSVAAVLVIIAIATVTALGPTSATIYKTEFNLQLIYYAVILFYVWTGFTAVDTDKVAGLDFGGKPVMQFGNGFKWYPWPVFKLTEESSLLVQGELPGDADKIYWDDEKKDLPPGLVRPIFVLTGENPVGTEPSERQVNLGVSIAVKFQVVSDRYFDLVRNIAPIDDENGQIIRKSVTGSTAATPRLLEVLRQLRDTASSFMAEVVGKMSYNEITLHRSLVDEWLAHRIRLQMIDWGLELREARLTKLNPGHRFNEEILQRATAVSKRDAIVTVAEGEKTQIILRGQGEAAARLAVLEAEAAGQEAIRKALEVSGEAVLAAELGRALAASGNVVIAPPGLVGIGAMLATGQQAVNKPKGGPGNTGKST